METELSRCRKIPGLGIWFEALNIYKKNTFPGDSFFSRYNSTLGRETGYPPVKIFMSLISE